MRILGMMNLWYSRGRLHYQKCFKNTGGVIGRVRLVSQTFSLVLLSSYVLI